MTKDDIIRMARKAGGADISSHGWTSWVGTQSAEFLERFAKLVAEREREACAKVCEDEAWRLKKLAVDTGSRSTNTKAIQASNDADAIRSRGTHD